MAPTARFAAWAFPPATVVMAVLFSAVVLGIGGFVGPAGGIVGGWLAGFVATRRSPAAESYGTDRAT